MRRKFVAAVSTALIVASLGVAQAPSAGASTSAAWPEDCLEGAPPRPSTTFVYVDSQGLHVSAGDAADDATALEYWAYAVFSHVSACLFSGVPTQPACLLAIIENIQSYVRVRGTTVDVYYPRLISDVRACTA